MDHGGHGMSGMGGMHMPMNLPPFSFGRGLEYSDDPFFLVGCLLALALYGWAVARLVRRGDSWPVGRTIAWTIGVLTVALTMCTKLNDYGMVMFSVHMVQHMIISMLSPILLLMGAPVTLTLRALPTAGRGRKGPRELLVMLLHSRYLQVITHPAFTIPLFIASLYGLYFTPLFDFLMESRIGHIAMMVHFLAVGLVFFWPIMGVDPGPHRPGHVMRILELFMGMPFHAFFGIALMMASQPMVKTFEHPPASLGIDALSDQHMAGGIAWAFSEIPSVLVLIALVFQWYVSEQRKAKREDRAADRDGDQELVAYNAYLASLQARGR
ncbi:cytochrome c oxidase assembly protein [Streptomyces sp. PTM05]|uniref:Cytochrome c oxidase assembly protein n=1 Tax=Streptantibioticus parmotrematis TaxID=2873249 RepID=A0ABS7QJD8_9ACTN|nr:cytochrome c oxidase assembly protein [Streptantibioticus parmotrematis]MBY8883283.1 cytochrome c oxidase assembly protein [Streptantibioticus parmotrematis]